MYRAHSLTTMQFKDIFFKQKIKLLEKIKNSFYNNIKFQAHVQSRETSTHQVPTQGQFCSIHTTISHLHIPLPDYFKTIPRYHKISSVDTLVELLEIKTTLVRITNEENSSLFFHQGKKIKYI